MPTVAGPTHSHLHAGGPTRSKPKLYNPRHPERTLLYQTVAEHYETWLELASAGQFDGQGDYQTPKPYVRQTFRKYLECGIFAHGFARARCGDYRLRKEGAALVYRCAKQHSEPGSDKRSAKVDEITLTPLELIDRIAALVPPPRTHRHRYFGVLAPNSPLRAAVTALAAPAHSAMAQVEPVITGGGNALLPVPEPAPPKRAAHYLWAVLIARHLRSAPALVPDVWWANAHHRVHYTQRRYPANTGPHPG